MVEKVTNSVLTRSEQFNKLLQPGNTNIISSDSVIVSINEKRHILGRAYYVVIALARGKCRVSEILNCTLNDIVSNDELFVKGLKGSRDKIIVVPELVSHFKKCKHYNIQPFAGLNRKYVWSRCKVAGLQVSVLGNKNMSVTHMYRHLGADVVRNVSSSELSVRDVLGHNSNVNSKYYGTKKVKRIIS